MGIWPQEKNSEAQHHSKLKKTEFESNHQRVVKRKWLIFNYIAKRGLLSEGTFKENEAKNVRLLIQGHTCSSWQLGFKKLLIFIW